MSYKHDEHTIDPRDTNLITYSKKSKYFIAEASMLHGSGIQPMAHVDLLGRKTKWLVYLWSEKHQVHVPYIHSNQVKVDGEVVADVFKPDFGIITSNAECEANSAAKGTELHIIND